MHPFPRIDFLTISVEDERSLTVVQNIIGVNLQNIQNDPDNWVEPRVFHPERFLPESDSRYQKRFDRDDKQAFQPFSVGGRNCMGGK